MNVFFIKPGSASTSFPHQYAILSAYIKQIGHKSNFYDAALNSESPQNIINKISFANTDIIAMSILTGWENWAAEFTNLLRQRYPSIKIIIGGPHISALREYAVEHIKADYGIIGEGEIPLGKLLDSLERNKSIIDIPGLIYKERENYKLNSSVLERIENLDKLPMPDYELINPEDYFRIYSGASVARKKHRIVQTVTSRGCPFECTFCATNCTWERRITFYSPKRIIREIKYLIKQYNIEEIWFGDDGFTANKKRTIEICNLIIKENIKIFWRLPNGIRAETIDDELISLVKKAGCYMVGIGVETGSNNMMKRIKKKLELKTIPEKIRILKKYNILASGFFIIGFDDETEEELKETVNFIINSPFERMQICIYNPIPGSESFNKIFEKYDPEKFNINIKRYLYEGYIPNFLKYLDISTIKKYNSYTYYRFYSKLPIFLSLIRNITFRQILDILRNPTFQRIFISTK